MQRLPQIMARRRQKAGFGEVGKLELLRALLDFALERSIRILKPGSHAVELIAESLELIAGSDRDALGEIAAADPRGTVPQGLDRHDHSAGKEQAGENRKYESGKEQRRGTYNRGIERRVGLLDRQLDKYQPAEQRYLGMRGQHLSALDVVRHWLVFRPHCKPLRARRQHLGKLRQVGILQHQTDVRMSDQATLGINDIPLSALADLDLGYHVPNEFEIHLRDDHTVVTAGAGHRQYHVRFGLLTEIDRAIIDLVRPGLDERRVAREILLAAELVHGEA